MSKFFSMKNNEQYFFDQIEGVLLQLKTVLEALPTELYAQPNQQLLGASIGEHVRHVIELFTCLLDGYDRKVVNYDLRKRDVLLQTDKLMAIEQLEHICKHNIRDNCVLALHTGHNREEEVELPFTTNYYRELLYNQEHSIHHMAILRIGINEVCDINLPDSFGVAAATIKNREHSCAP